MEQQAIRAGPASWLPEAGTYDELRSMARDAVRATSTRTTPNARSPSGCTS